MFKKQPECLDACSEGYFSRHEGIVAHTIQRGCENRRPEEEEANQNPRDDRKGPLKTKPYLRRNWQLMANGREKTTYLTMRDTLQAVRVTHSPADGSTPM